MFGFVMSLKLEIRFIVEHKDEVRIKTNYVNSPEMIFFPQKFNLKLSKFSPPFQLLLKTKIKITEFPRLWRSYYSCCFSKLIIGGYLVATIYLLSIAYSADFSSNVTD